VKLSNARVLVTGAGGFIGSHLTEAVMKRARAVRAFAHYNALGRAGWLDHSAARNEVDVIFGDICDRETVAAAMKGIDAVLHLAALIPIPYSYKAPASYVRTNIEGTLNVLLEARSGGQRVIHTSTSEVYGTARYVPIDEKHPLQGQSPYAASKIGADKMVEAFHLSFGVPTVTIRPFNTFGPRQSARAVIPTIISQALKSPDQPIRLGSTSPRRDLNFVANTVDGYLRSVEHDSAIGETINLSSGREVSIGDLVQIIGSILGHEIRIQTDKKRVRPRGSEVERLLGANARARKLLGWKPAVGLEKGLEHTVDWIREHINEYRAREYAV